MSTKGYVWTELVWENEDLALSKTHTRTRAHTQTHTHTSHFSAELVLFPNRASCSQCRWWQRQHLPLSDAVFVTMSVPSSTREECHMVLLSSENSSHSSMHTAVYSMNQTIFSTFSVLLPFLVITEKLNVQCCTWSSLSGYKDRRTKEIATSLLSPPHNQPQVSESSACFCSGGKWEGQREWLRLSVTYLPWSIKALTNFSNSTSLFESWTKISK